MHIETPTPERLVQAGRSIVFGSAIRSVEIVRDGRPQVEQIRVPRIRVEEDPFTRLANRGQLDPENEDVNRWLKEAGEKYRALYHKAGLEPLQGQDPTRGFTASKNGAGLLASEKKCDAYDAWYAANQAIGPHSRRIVDDILLHGAKPEAAAEAVSIYKDKKLRIGICMTFLRLGLADLDRHFA